MNKALIIFIKNPELGKVKTRLAKSIGDQNALEVYKILIRKTHAVAIKVLSNRLLFYSNEITTSDIWDPEHYHKYLQVEGDLGDKMKAAFKVAFDAKNKKVIIIGSDCYDLSEGIIEEAFDELDSSDAVIGPANDGGYYLLGMKTYMPEVFNTIKWSTSSVFSKTMDRFKLLNQSVVVLPELIDIDELSDLKASSFDLSKLDLANSPT